MSSSSSDDDDLSNYHEVLSQPNARVRSHTFKTESSAKKQRRGSEQKEPSGSVPSGDKIEDALCNRKLEAASVSSG